MLHGSWVRASFACYSKFTLLINSSPGFGSSPCHYIRPFRLAFTLTPQQSCLVNDIELTRWIVLQKARSHPAEAGLLLFVSIWFQILFHLPHRDTFHLSLTVLVHYRSLKIFSLGAIVAPASNGISPVPPYLRITSS